MPKTLFNWQIFLIGVKGFQNMGNKTRSNEVNNTKTVSWDVKISPEVTADTEKQKVKHFTKVTIFKKIVTTIFIKFHDANLFYNFMDIIVKYFFDSGYSFDENYYISEKWEQI